MTTTNKPKTLRLITKRIQFCFILFYGCMFLNTVYFPSKESSIFFHDIICIPMEAECVLRKYLDQKFKNSCSAFQSSFTPGV